MLKSAPLSNTRVVNKAFRRPGVFSVFIFSIGMEKVPFVSVVPSNKIVVVGSKYLDYTTGKLTNTKTKNSFSLSENDVNFLKEVYNKNIPSFEANYLKIITIIALFLQNQFDIKLNSIDLLNNY